MKKVRWLQHKKKQQQEKIGQLQVIQHNQQGVLAQKQQFQAQLYEINSALEEIDTSEEVYKILGGVLLKKKKEDIKKELTEKKEIVTIRITTIEKQEKRLQEQAQTIQEALLQEMSAEEKVKQ